MSSKKQLRRHAVEGELARRYRNAEQQCPLSRTELNSLLDYLAESLAPGGYGKTFEHTRQWLSQYEKPVDITLEFFKARRLTDDWEVAIGGDPHKLFGPTEFQIARMPIPRDAFDALIKYLDDRVREFGCDNTRRMTREWLARERWPVHPTEFALVALGGGCDCEVVMNVEPSNIFLPRPSSHTG